MTIERVLGGSCLDPFPVYPRLADALAGAHVASPLQRDSTVAHVLGTCAGYAYADADTVATVMCRLGLEGHATVRIGQVVDAMFIFSTAYLVQSQCGRVVILCYRGTEPGVLGNWLGDADVGPDSNALVPEDGGARYRVHGGFHRNLRATWWAVLTELRTALAGGSVADPGARLAHPMEALYVTGHSLGGAMALLFLLKLSGDPTLAPILQRLRAVYTYGAPMALLMPVPPSVEQLTAGVFRHVLVRDPVPALPAASWGPFVHVGQEYRYLQEEWQRSGSPIAQLPNLLGVPRFLLRFFQSEGRREASAYAMSEHGAQHYVAALRPRGQVTEYGDRVPP